MMHKRLYHFDQKRKLKDGTIKIYHNNNSQWKWVKTKRPQRKYEPRGSGMNMWSKRFGYMNLYTEAERKMLTCPSGYTFGQGMCALQRLWTAYKNSKTLANIDKMEKYARAIQDVQEDLGLKTTSFPHLGIYGDQLTLYDYSPNREDGTSRILVYADHSHLKEKQEMEEAKEKLEQDVSSLIMLEPDVEKGEELLTIADEIPQLKVKANLRPRVRHENRMHYTKKRDYEWVCEKCDETVPPNKNHICELKQHEKNVLTMTDDIPFLEKGYEY